MYVLALLAFLPALSLAQQGSINRAAEALFQAIDINNDRRIIPIELQAYFLSYDANEDGNITHAEFNRAIDHQGLGFQGHEVAVYNLFDQDDNNGIDKADIDAVFKKADANGDNHVSDQEFHTFINSIPNIIGG